MTFLKSMSLIT